ncbi:MAG: FAD-binding protein, partial [Chloroflexota bacterium]|nr:FAD-binding protein [Chloroflexota bacterium]
ERFMARYHELAELAPRDVVARAAVTEMSHTKGECIYLDLRHMDAAETRTHFPTIYSRCRRYGLDITTDPVPVAPAAHYMTGGVRTDLRGRTSVPGLYACGEVACTGVHGANRLASNSLLEALVFARRIVLDSQGISVPEYALLQKTEPALARSKHVRVEIPPVATTRKRAGGTLPALKRLMWHNTGIVREEAGLAEAEAQLQEWLARTPAGKKQRQYEYRSSLVLGLLLTTAARMRRESRGAHYRQDFPDPHDSWRHRIVIYPESCDNS